ncbi:carbohydrate ABC transporter permease [Actinacidiphila yanglinensis]|uniref:carbohydrate ABC transporter permease n=1 Tax=Actinacidiphila yanglinensis TaxID=310779 RepID=UPI000CDE66E1|nr:sugar ABC transporter permease [Actinacidiphila yanglinensis]
MSPHRRRRRWLGLAYLAPALLVYAVVVLLPAVQGVRLSFYHWDGVTSATWAGFANYTGFVHDPTLRQAVAHTLFFIVFFSVLPIALGMSSAALTARRDVRGSGVYRWIIFLPQVLTPAVAAVVWKRIYAPAGPINSVLTAFGLGGLTRGWLGDYTWALPALGLAGTWGAYGLCMVLFGAGIQNIPSELYDAARMDGAGPLREFFTVTLPGLRGQLAVVLTLTMLGAIRVFDIVWLTTRGGPGTSTITPTVVLYQRAFANPDVGAACAIGVVLAVVSLIISLVVVKLSESDD